VLDQAEEHRRLLGAAWVLITNEHGVLVARTDYPTEFDIDLSRGALIANALSGDETSGAWLDERRRKLFMAVAVPLRASPQAAPQGSLVAAYAIDDTLAHQIKQATTTDVVLFALASSYVLARQIAGPIRRLALATRRVQDGDYSVEIGVPAGDEIGMLAQAFQSLVADLKEKAKLVEYLMSASGAAPTESLRVGRPSPAPAGDVLRPGTPIGKQLCRALEVAHEQGVIHRDIKPQNIVVEPSGVLKVMDFGIARLANRSKDEGLTREGMSIGTPDYMSPEQLSGMELDARSDLYSAGVVLFECLTRRLPFEAATTYALIAKQLGGGAARSANSQSGRARSARAGDSQGDGEGAGGPIPDRGANARRAGG